MRQLKKIAHIFVGLCTTMTQGHGWKNDLLEAGGDQDLLTHIYGNCLVHSYSIHSKLQFATTLLLLGQEYIFSQKNAQRFHGACTLFIGVVYLQVFLVSS